MSKSLVLFSVLSSLGAAHAVSAEPLNQMFMNEERKLERYFEDSGVQSEFLRACEAALTAKGSQACKEAFERLSDLNASWSITDSREDGSDIHFEISRGLDVDGGIRCEVKMNLLSEESRRVLTTFAPSAGEVLTICR